MGLLMWQLVGVFLLVVWILFIYRARALTRIIDRAEVLYLKPLSISYLVLLLAFAATGLWLLAGASALAWILTGGIGAALHPKLSVGGLVQGTIHHMEEGSQQEPSLVESHQVARVTLRATAVLGFLVFAILVQLNFLRWYAALPLAFVSAYVLMVAVMFMVAYRPKRGQ